MKAPKIRFKGFGGAWEEKKLNSTCTILKGQQINKESLLEYGKYYVLNGGKTPSGYIDKFNTTKNTISVSEGGNSCGYVSFNKKEFWSGGHNYTLKSPNIDVPFLFQNLKGKEQKIMALRVGSGLPNIQKNRLEEFIIGKPSLPEQEKIGAFFEKLDTQITQQYQKLEKLKNMKHSFLQKLFPKDGSALPELRFKGFEGAWEERKIDDICNRFDNLRIPISAKNRIPGSIPYYGANGIQDYVDGYTHNGEFLLIAEDGANDLKNYPIQYVKGKIWVNNHAHVLQGKQELSNNIFLKYAIKHTNIEALLVGGGRAKLNASVLMGIDISLPSLPEQEKIGAFFEKLDTQITQQTQKIQKLQNLKQSLLEKMFI